MLQSNSTSWALLKLKGWGFLGVYQFNIQASQLIFVSTPSVPNYFLIHTWIQLNQSIPYKWYWPNLSKCIVGRVFDTLLSLMSVYLPFLILSLFCTWSCRLWMTTTLLEVDFGSYPWLISSLRLVFSLFVQHVPQHLSCFLRWVRATASYHPHCSASSLSAWVSSLIPVSLRDWLGIGSVRVRGSQARTWTCTLRFGSRTCRTWTHTKCSGSECSVRVHTMFEVKKSLNLANLSTIHLYFVHT